MQPPGNFYYFMLSGPNLHIAISLWGAGLIVILVNSNFFARNRKSVILPIIGLLLATALVFLGVICLDAMLYAQYLGTNSDGYPYDLPLSDVGPLAIGTSISLFIALLVGSVSIHRISNLRRKAQRTHA